jgi:hypothetical protein
VSLVDSGHPERGELDLEFSPQWYAYLAIITYSLSDWLDTPHASSIIVIAILYVAVSLAVSWRVEIKVAERKVAKPAADGQRSVWMTADWRHSCEVPRDSRCREADTVNDNG